MYAGVPMAKGNPMLHRVLFFYTVGLIIAGFLMKSSRNRENLSMMMHRFISSPAK
jgi:hypothetical protein